MINTQPFSPSISWDATAFFRDAVARNRLAQSLGFRFATVSSLQGFEDALNQLQSATALVAVSDTSDGQIKIDNTPHTQRVKTVFIAMRHPLGDMAVRAARFDTMRELFRQLMSLLILETTRLEQQRIFLDPQISFNEISRYFYNGAACAYFQISTTTYTSLTYDPAEWQ